MPHPYPLRHPHSHPICAEREVSEDEDEHDGQKHIRHGTKNPATSRWILVPVQHYFIVLHCIALHCVVLGYIILYSVAFLSILINSFPLLISCLPVVCCSPTRMMMQHWMSWQEVISKAYLYEEKTMTRHKRHHHHVAVSKKSGWERGELCTSDLTINCVIDFLVSLSNCYLY